MKTISNCCPFLTKESFKNATNNIKAFLLLFLLLSVAELSSAQSGNYQLASPNPAPPVPSNCSALHASPSCNIEGPLAACLYGGQIMVTITEDFSLGNVSELSVSLPPGPGNTSGGDIISGPTKVSYLGSTLTATVVIAPGYQQGTIFIEVEDTVVYPDGCVMTNGCDKSISIINVVATAQAATFCTGGATTVTLTASSQADSIAYIIGSGAKADTNYTGVFPNLSAGIDTFTVIAIEPQAFPYTTLFCPFTLIDTLKPAAPPAAPICSNNGPLTCTMTSVTLTANGCTPTPGVTYSWTGPGFTSSLQCPTTSTAGTYTVTADSTVSGCTSTCTTTVISNTTPPSVTCSNNGPLTCTTTSVTLSANGCTSTPGVTYSWSGPGNYSSSSQCPTNATVAGTYTVTATNTSNGCTATCTTVVGSNTTPPSLICSNNGPLTCTTLSVTLSANSCTGTGVTYSWSGPSYSSSLQCPANASAAGTYTVTATSASNGCTSTCSTVVASNTTPPSLICSNNGPLTCTTKSVTLSANSCTGTGITYSWSGPSYSSSLQCPANASAAGTYTVTATSTSNGCTSTCTTAVTSNTTPPSLICSNNGPLTCTTTSVTLSANSCTGTGITYSWSGPSYSSSLQCPSNASAAGTYTVTATSTSNGCTSTCTTAVTSNTTPPSLICSNNGPLTCTNTSVTLSANSCTGTGITYSWSGPSYSSSLQCPSNASAAGTYTVTATSTSNGCTSTCTTAVSSNTTPPALTCTNGGPLTCTNTSVTLSANNCTGTGVTYSWSGPSYSSSLQCPANASAAGTYTVTATSTSDGCTSTCTTVVASNITPPALTCTNSGPLTCTTTSVTLSANACVVNEGITYSWSGPNQYSSTAQCPTNASVAGTYTVTATNVGNGCSATCTTVVGSNITPPSLICSNNGPLTCTTKSVTLSANSCTGTGITYSWSGPSYSSSLQCPANASAAGTYTVTATSTSNGCTSTCTTAVTSNTTPPSLICSNNGPLTCTTTSVTLSANSCTGTGITYSWSGPSYSSSLQCPANASAAGTYTVTATSTSNGCTSTCTTAVTSNTTPPSLICSNNGPLTCTTTSVTLSANSCTGTGVTYSWSGPSYSSSLQCPSNASAAGTYTVTATSTSNGCTSTCTTAVTSNTTPPALTCSNGGPLTCTTTSVTLSANSCSSTPGVTYAWRGPNGYSSASQCPTNATAAGTYTVTATNTSNGCTSTCTTSISSNTTPPSLICSNNGPLTCTTTSVTLSANGCTGTGVTYSWSGPGYSSSLQCPANASAAGTYTVTATSTSNGCTSTCTTVVNSNTTPPALTCGGGTLTCTTTSVSLTANSCTGTGVSYSWSGAGYSSSSQCPSVSAAGTYTVTATSTANGCTSTCTAVVGSNTTPPSLTCNNNGPLTCSVTSVSIAANNCTEGSGLSYSWSGPSSYGSSSQCTSVSVAGTYTVTETSASNGCTSTCTTTVASNTTPPALTCGGGALTCTVSSIPLSANSCTGTGITYSWKGPGNYSSSLQCPSVGAAGTYTVTATSASNGCTSTCTANVSSNTTPPTAGLTAPTNLPICGSTGNTLGATPASGVTYVWSVTSPGNTWVITSSNTANPITYTGGSSGSATFTVVETSTTNGCTASASVTISCMEDLWGCTLGFWKNHVSIWDAPSQQIPQCLAGVIASFGSGYSGDGTDNSSFATTFGVTAAQMTAVGYSPTLTLLQALNTGGGGFSDLARQGVAALINGCGLSGHYRYTTAQVIAAVHSAIVTDNSNPISPSFDDANEQQPDNCPPAGKATKRIANDGIAINENVTINAYPNPFTDMMTIEIAPNTNYDNAIVGLYDVSGKLVRLVYTGAISDNQTYHFQVDGSTLAQGVYIYNFKAADENIFGKVILIK